MSIKTRNPKSKANKINQGVVIQSRNGLPLDSYVTVEGTRPLYKSGNEAIVSYSEPLVTVSSSIDLEAIRLSSTNYTGKLVLITRDGAIYFINRLTIDNAASTFEIFNDNEFTESPSSIELAGEFIIAEANLVNKLATTSAAHIDEVEFNGFDVSFNLDGAADSVSIVDGNNQLTINPDGSINTDVIIDAEQGDTIAISRHATPFERVAESSLTEAQLDTTTFTTIHTYNNSLEELRIKSVKADASTFGVYQVRVNGVLKDRFRTSPTDRNCRIEFSQEIDLPQGQALTIEFKPERLRIPNYNFFIRLEGYQNID